MVKEFIISLGRQILDICSVLVLILAIVLVCCLVDLMDSIGVKNTVSIGTGIIVFFVIVILLVLFCFRLYLLIDINDNLKKLLTLQGEGQQSDNDISDEEKLEGLASLKERGIITEEQYTKAKNRIISDIRRLEKLTNLKENEKKNEELSDEERLKKLTSLKENGHLTEEQYLYEVELERLAKLKENGHLTEEQYLREVGKIINNIK